jgi:hypothetical protein
MVIKMMWGKKHSSIEDVISEKQITFSSNLQMKQRRSIRSKASKLKISYKSLSCTSICWSAFDDSSLFIHALVLGPSATIMSEASSDSPRCMWNVWSFLVRSSLFEITITENVLSEFVIWVSHSPRILLSVTLRLLWVSHIPTILLGVSFRSLSSRPLRGFIYSNFLFLLLCDGWIRFLKGLLACCRCCRAVIFGMFIFL